MKKYELMFIIYSAKTEEEKTAVIADVQKVVEGVGATDLTVDKWGERKLAYPIDKKSTGYYVLFKFTVDGTKLIDVEEKLNINESLMRYILVKQD